VDLKTIERKAKRLDGEHEDRTVTKKTDRKTKRLDDERPTETSGTTAY